MAYINQQYEPYPQAGSPPVQTSSQTVVVTQPTNQNQYNYKREWTSDLTDCTKDCGICWCVICCSPFYQCYKMGEFDEHCCSAWPCCFGHVGAVVMLRYRMRHKENIQGSMMKDCCAAMCCYPCMTCQLYREHDHVRSMNGQVNMANTTVITQSHSTTPINNTYQPQIEPSPPYTPHGQGYDMSKTQY